MEHRVLAKRSRLPADGGYVLGHFNAFTPGQSGGAVWGWWDGELWSRVVVSEAQSAILP